MTKIKKKINFGTTEADAAISIIKRIKSVDGKAFIVGGAVRDCLLGHIIKDVDVATNLLLTDLVDLFGESNVNFVGESFGVAIVSHMDEKVEVATFRKDGEYSDGRRPDSVEFSDSAEEDSKRRDLTINALYYDPVEFVIHDFHGGMADIELATINTVGDPVDRFAEDYLRMLRVVRFASALSFNVAANVQAEICKSAYKISQISGERLFMELDKMFRRSPVAALCLLRRLRLLKHVLLEVDDLIGLQQPLNWHPEGDVWDHILVMLTAMSKPASSELVWSVILHDIGKSSTYGVNTKGRICFHGHDEVGAEMVENILRRLKCSSKFIKTVSSVVENHTKMAMLLNAKRSKVRRQLARPTIDLDLALCRLDAIGKGSACNFTNYDRLKEMKEEYVSKPAVPPPLVTGVDAMNIGIVQGPEIGRVLRQIQDLQLEGSISTREEAILHLQMSL